MMSQHGPAHKPTEPTTRERVAARLPCAAGGAVSGYRLGGDLPALSASARVP